MTRKEILDAALSCVNGERDRTYGSPEDNFRTIAELWNIYCDVVSHKVPDDEEWSFEPKDVAAMLALLKIARIASGQAKDDNWIDLAGYAACGGEVQSSKDNDKYFYTESGEKVIKSAVSFGEEEKLLEKYELESYKKENEKLRHDLTIANLKLKSKELEEELNIFDHETLKNVKPPKPCKNLYKSCNCCNDIHTNPEDSNR